MPAPENDTKNGHIASLKAPWIELAALLNLILRDAVGAIVIVGVAHLVEIVIGKIAGQSWKFAAGNLEIAPSDIVHYWDLAILVGFMFASLYDFWNWMRKR